MRKFGILLLKMLGWVALAMGVIVGTVYLLERAVPDEALAAFAPWQVYAMVIPATLFPILYLTFYRWYLNPLGRALMTLAVGMLLLIDMSAYFNITKGEYGWALEVQAIIFTVVLVGLWYQFIVFLKIRFGRKHRERTHQTKADEHSSAG